MKILPLRLSVVFALSILSSLVGCSNDDSSSEVKTDLRDNKDIKTTLAAYKTNAEHCVFKDGQKRVIVTGFGLFGEARNISGIVAMSMAKPDFLPENLDLTEAAVAPENVWAQGENQTTNGGYATQRALTIDGETFEVCFLLLDVKWDLAASIILFESSRFKPDMVIMSGMNGTEDKKALFESGAVNIASSGAGFDAAGNRDPDNATRQPQFQQRVIPDMYYGQKVALTWNAVSLATANRSLVAEIESDVDYTVDFGPIRSNNNYVCNNVSIAVGSALANRPIQLAGGLVRFSGMNFGTKVGFLHFPYLSSEEARADDGVQVYGWAKVVANSIKTSL